MTYELYYWPGIQGRGEFVRLALEAAGPPYVDVARERGEGRGIAAMTKVMRDKSLAFTPFAPPFLRDGDLIVSQVANILLHLGPKLGLAPRPKALIPFAHGVQLTITDCVSEVHDTHHPISNGLYYEDQKTEAKARATAFLDTRLPKFLGYFENVLTRNPAGPRHSVGRTLTTLDLSLFQLCEGLAYAFPKAMAKFARDCPALADLSQSVRERPAIAAYLASPRRLPFNESGVFRHYPELDRDADQ